VTTLPFKKTCVLEWKCPTPFGQHGSLFHLLIFCLRFKVLSCVWLLPFKIFYITFTSCCSCISGITQTDYYFFCQLLKG